MKRPPDEYQVTDDDFATNLITPYNQKVPDLKEFAKQAHKNLKKALKLTVNGTTESNSAEKASPNKEIEEFEDNFFADQQVRESKQKLTTVDDFQG